jgi:hypothetical protein
MELLIVSYEAVGPIIFGMHMTEVRAVIGLPFESFRKTQVSTVFTDAFIAAGIHVHYDAERLCEAVELAKPADPIVRGSHLIGEPFSNTREWLRVEDKSIVEDSSGCTTFLFGIGIYAPNAKDRPSDPVQGVIAFRRGYYD